MFVCYIIVKNNWFPFGHDLDPTPLPKLPQIQCHSLLFLLTNSFRWSLAFSLRSVSYTEISNSCPVSSFSLSFSISLTSSSDSLTCSLIFSSHFNNSRSSWYNDTCLPGLAKGSTWKWANQWAMIINDNDNDKSKWEIYICSIFFVPK